MAGSRLQDLAIILACVSLGGVADPTCDSAASASTASALAQLPLIHRSERVQSAREAVYVDFGKLDNLCVQQVLLALVRSRSPKGGAERDVWYAHDLRPPSFDSMVSQLEMEGLKMESRQPMEEGCSSNFTGEDGAGKGAFINFALRHQEYDRFWYVEEDCIYTGRWSGLFDSVASSNADVVGTFLKSEAEVKVITPRLQPGECKVKGGDCVVGTDKPSGLNWFVTRFSRKFIQELDASMKTGETCGHHVELATLFCDASDWCSAETLPIDRLGEIHQGYAAPFSNGNHSWRRMLEVGNLVAGIPSNKVFHPVECHVNDTSVGYFTMAYASQEC